VVSDAAGVAVLAGLWHAVNRRIPVIPMARSWNDLLGFMINPEKLMSIMLALIIHFREKDCSKIVQT
jgi:hypothetical protein